MTGRRVISIFGVVILAGLCVTALLWVRGSSRRASALTTEAGQQPGAAQPGAPEMTLSVNRSIQPVVTRGAPLVLAIMIQNGRASRAALAAAARAGLQRDLDAHVQAGTLTRQQADAQLTRKPILAPVKSVVITFGTEQFSFNGGSPPGSAPLPWRPKIAIPTSPTSVTLDGKQLAYVTFVVAPDETTSTRNGTYQLRASFENRSSGQWQGTMTSNPVTVTVVDAPAAPSVAEQKAHDSLRFEYFLALKDYDHALEAALHVLSLDPGSIDGSFMLGTVQEGTGALQSALGAYETALTKFHDRYHGDDPPEALLQAVHRVRDKLGIKLAPIVESQ